MSQTSTHCTTFHQYIRAGVQASLARVQAEHVVPETDRQQAWHILSFALNVPEVWDVTRALLLVLAPKMEQAGFREEWLCYLEQGLRQSQKLGDDITTAELQFEIGLLCRLQSEFGRAQFFLSASVDSATVLRHTYGQRRAYNELAYLAFLQHRYQEAETYVQQALFLSDEEDAERAMSYRVKGMIEIDHNRWQDAETYHRNALRLFEKYNNRRKIAWSLQNIGYALRGQQKYVDAISYLMQAGTILSELRDIFHWAIVQMNIGIAYMYNMQPNEAQPYYVHAETSFRRLGSKQFQAKVNINFGLNYLALNDLRQAEQAFALSIELFHQLGDDSERLNAMDGLALVYLAQKQFEKATDLLNQALAELPIIIGKPIYEYLAKSLHGHLEEAQRFSEDAKLAPSENL